MSPIEHTLLTAALPMICGVLAREIVQLGLAAKTKLAANPKLAALAPVVEVLEDAATAAEEAVKANFNKGTNAAALAALQAALAVLKAEEPKLVAAAEAEATSLLVNEKSPVVAPGGAVVKLPEIK